MRAATIRAWGLAGLVCATLGAVGCKRPTVRAPEEPAATAGVEAGPQPELVVQAGSSHWVRDTKFSPDGRWLAVASVDGLVKLYDVRMGKEWRTLTGATGPVHALSWSGDGKRLAAAGFDKAIHVWEVASGVEVATLPGHSGWVGSVEFSPDGKRLASAAQIQDQVVAIWDLEQKAVKHALMHTQEVKDLAWSRDGKTLLTVTDEVQVWNAEAGGLLGTIAVAAGGAGGKRLRFSPDGKLVAIDAGEAVHVYDAGSWAEAARVPGTLVGWANDGELTVHRGRELLRVEPRSGRRISGFAAAQDSGLARAELSPGGRVAAAIDDMQVDLYDGATGAKLRTFRSTFWNTVGGAFGNDAKLLHVAWSPNAPVIATAGFDGLLRVIDLRRGAAPKSVPAGPKVERDPAEENFLGFEWAKVGLVDDVQFSRDGRHLITRDGLGVSMWDARTLTLVRRFAAEGATAQSMAPDGNSLAIAHGDAVVSVYEVATGKRLRSSKGGGLEAGCQESMGRQTLSTMATVSGLGWSADAKTIYVVFKDTSTFVEFDAKTFALGKGGCAHRDSINGVTWSDARDKVAIGAGTHMLAQTISEISFGDNAVHVFGLAGEMPLLHRLKGHSLAVLGADFSRDGNLLATASADRTARLWDMRTGSLVATLAGHGAEVDSVAFSHDDRFVATASYDLTVKVWDLATKAEVATIVTIGADGYVIETPDHYYTASRQGFESVSFRLGETIVPVELFDLRLNRPDLVLRRFGYAPPELLGLYEKAYKKRLKKMRIDEASLRPEYHLPTAKITSEVPVSTPERTLQLQLTATDDRFELDRLLVYVNDVPIHGSAGIDLRPENSRRHERSLAIELLPGRNKIQVSTLNAAGTESRKDTVEVVSTASARASDLYVLAVGVSQYADVKLNLKYAAKDARDVAGLFKARGKRFGKVEVLQILDGEARRENILAARQALQNTKIDDQVVVFVAGHGMLDTNLDYYFVTHDFEREAPGKRGLSYEQLESLLDGIPARRKLMMMDTCHSGEVDEDAIRTPPPVPGGAVRGGGQVKLATDFRSFSYSGAIQSPDSTHELLAQLFADLRRGSGAAVISSASGAEFALESPQWQNGVFTFSVLQGLTSGLADLDRDGTIRVSELRDYVVGEVRRLTQGAQTPTSRRENLEFDFPVL
ncbi:caspase family protein [Nannocystis bainbridge]|uniref:Caspase family protein n=1 Tax=Nannocystis bainbridge TaxID=2995303 RepID=A0ABT5E880_9BACT|nr:caspase family protein [Nannocystis bainbridge]MDC0722069.1 caspase family protein [Nannocystis bainbridge]